MIGRQLVSELSDNQKGMLLFIVNEGHSFFIDLDTVCSYKLPALHQRLEAGKTRIKKEHLNEYKHLCAIMGMG